MACPVRSIASPLSFTIQFAIPLAFAFAFASSAPAQDPPKPGQEAPPKAAAEPAPKTAAKPGLELMVPPAALLFVGVDSLDGLRADWNASPWGRLVADPANEGLRKSMAHLFTKLGATTAKETGVDFVEAFDRVTGRFGVGCYGDPEMKGHDFGFTLGAESIDHIAELRAFAQKLLDKSSEEGTIVQKTETEGDVEVTLAVSKTGEADFPEMRIGAAGSVLLFDGAAGSFLPKPNFHNAVAALKGEGKESLATLPAFRDSRAAKPGGVKIWFDTGAVIRAKLAASAAAHAASAAAQDEEPDYDVTLMNKLGMDELGALSGRLDVNATEMRVEAQQAWSGKGLLAQLLTAWLAGNDFSLLKFVPADVEHALSVHVDFAKGMEVSKAIEKAVNPDAAAAEAGAPADPNAPPDGEAPFDVRKDYLDHLDGRIAFFISAVDPSEALPIPGMGKPRGFCVALGVKSADPLRASLEKVLRSTGLHAARKKAEFLGFQVYSVPVTPFTIHYAILDDMAIVSTSPTLLQDVLRRKSDKELKNLAGDASFKREFEALSPGAALVVWSRADPGVFATLGAPLGADEEGAAPNFGSGEDGADGGAKPGGGDEGSPESALKHELHDLLEALSKVDPAVAAKHLPAGSVIGLGVNAAGVHFEGVSR